MRAHAGEGTHALAHAIANDVVRAIVRARSAAGTLPLRVRVDGGAVRVSADGDEPK